jgi:hypothetical protein
MENMEKIPTSERAAPADFERAIDLNRENKKKISKSFIGNAGIFTGVFIMFVVVMVVTTDISLNTFEDAAAVWLDFFLLMFCSYSMYVNCADSGMRYGLRTDKYISTINMFEQIKKYIINSKLQSGMPKFCRYYIETELKSIRSSTLAIVGLSYEEYESQWLGKDEDYIRACTELSSSQKDAVIKANCYDPVVLTPEMIMRRGRRNGRRSPLGVTPETKKAVNYVVKFITTFVVAFAFSIIVLDVVSEPTWVTFATCCLKLVTIVMNGFSGYKYGYENIVFDTVNYVSDQTDLMRQAVDYIESNDDDRDSPCRHFCVEE